MPIDSIRRTTGLCLVATGMFVFSCAAPALAPTPSAPTEPTRVTAADVQAGATATLRPTPAPTATVWPPVFDPWALGDIRALGSFTVTINEKNTVNGQLTELTTTIGYIQEPYSAYRVTEFDEGNSRTYLVEGRTYAVNNSGDWYLSTRIDEDDVFSKADIPAGNTGKLEGARFAGQEDFQGIPANHFVFEQPASTSEPNKSYAVEGDFYLAQAGNYVLYSHWKETSSQGNFTQVYEVTESLSSINQLTEITLPSDLQEMKTAMDLPLELGLPLPPDSALEGMIRYRPGIGVDLYTFRPPQWDVEDFLEYYKNLPPTDGWTVTHVGHVNLHENNCEFTHECVILNKGNTQVILYYNGSTIRAEFDWPHLYSPL